ncbi:MAG: DeoR family transcriptional regulator, partial [Bdellovibrionota bacterium]
GVASYRYYEGRFRKAERAAERSLKYSIRANFLYGKVFAVTMLGHVRVQLGRISLGLSQLAQARDLAAKLGDGALKDTIAASHALFSARFAVEPAKDLRVLEVLDSQYLPANWFFHADILFEMSRQYALRGELELSHATLERAVPLVHKYRNRRQEITLGVLQAHLRALQGEPRDALEVLPEAKAKLNAVVDRAIEMTVLGLERDLRKALGAPPGEIAPLDVKLRQITEDTGDYLGSRILSRRGLMNAPKQSRGEDPLGDLLDAIAAEGMSAANVRKIVKSGWHGLFRPALAADPKKKILNLMLIPGHFVCFHRGSVFVSAPHASDLLCKILALLHERERSKQELIELVWGYKMYHPLQHNALVYAAIAKLRKLLGPHSEWIQGGESGYSVADRVEVFLGGEGRESELSSRQSVILEYLAKHPSIHVTACCELLEVSAATGTRELSALVELGLIERHGRGPKTAYSLRQK